MLDPRLTHLEPRTSAAQVAADQLVYCPFWYLMFFSVLGIMEGKSGEAIQNRVVNDIPKMVVTNWTVWIPVMIISFTVRPPTPPAPAWPLGHGCDMRKSPSCCACSSIYNSIRLLHILLPREHQLRYLYDY